MTKKVTKKDVLAAVATLAADVTLENGVNVTAEDIVTYCNVTVDQLNKKNEKAKERAAEKKAAGNELVNKIADMLTDEFQTIPAIVDALGDEEVTAGKVSARLTQLVKADRAHKSKVKVGDRTLTGYAAGPAPVEADAE